MKPESLIEFLAERPFKPLRLRLADGRHYEVVHPELAIVGEGFVTLGIPRNADSKVATRLTHCSLAHVVEVEPVAAAG
ncbi:MAG: hypothetical protein AAF805_14510 [Planctomycetota bacterium]